MVYRNDIRVLPDRMVTPSKRNPLLVVMVGSMFVIGITMQMVPQWVPNSLRQYLDLLFR